MLSLRKFCLYLTAPAVLGTVLFYLFNYPALAQLCAVIAAPAFALGLGALPNWKGYQYTAWILAAVVLAMIFPAAFLRWGSFDLRNKWVVLVVVQLVMFGMGTQMSLRDFAGVMKTPYGVFIAVAGQFLIMPLTGWALTKLFALPDEIAAGVILIGCCSSGLASNVMCFIAKANLALSITATAITTLVAPFMTPLWMKLLAGALVEVKFLNMMTEIVKIVIVPIGAALLHDYLKYAPTSHHRLISRIALACAIYVGLLLSPLSPLTSPSLTATCALLIELSGFIAGAVVFGRLYHVATRKFKRLDSFMPLVSMAGIVYFTTITTAAGRDNLLKVGAVLIAVAILHNTAGYFFGYWVARAARLDRASCRTVAIEVGLQNGGMASGLAGAMGKLATVGLAAAVFSPWMNISGSILANYWKKRPVGPGPTPDETN